MPRVIGNDIPGNKRLAISLTYIYGIGRALAQEVIEKLGLDPNMRAHNLTEAEISKLNAILQTEYVVEGDLRRQVQNNIKRLISINCYRGTRHRSGLPLRGQRTRCNARTRKGKKKTVAGKKKAPQG
ncbi:30S ribosomal protein S13 [Simkania negevensis]|uniref:Small ribosomal subunit protein uS13 n=1 Tax=Simkania negevensis (strain ATCC VR-1471 / DSM 27360 / Z) TaxID=331113 RepID=F8L3V8_SIMNZ|nr:30S ribosomal protein S13 [Simkania negevensis]MCB1074429.1 30S ribosomal protein S13 [Simkania sp.]CCB89986.1 30S ribosomal protein S13 [Simkania negevensis Z]